MTSTTINEWSHLGQTMLFTACKTISLLLNEWLNPTLTCEIILLTKRKNVDRKWTPYEVAYINQAKARECLRSQGELWTISHLFFYGEWTLPVRLLWCQLLMCLPCFNKTSHSFYVLKCDICTILEYDFIFKRQSLGCSNALQTLLTNLSTSNTQSICTRFPDLTLHT